MMEKFFSTKKSKYVIVRIDETEVPIVFSWFLKHEAVAKVSQVTSAGYCTLTGGGKWIVGGWSDSLKLGARPEDAEILNTRL